MLCFDQNGNAFWCQNPIDGLCNLCGHGFLGLQALGIDLNHTCQLGNSHHFIGWNIGNMRLAQDGNHMVLAMTFQIDVAQHDHIVVAFDFFKGFAQNFIRIFVIACKELFIGFNDTLWRFEQAFAFRIVARP